jgi:hypothetical protein
MMALLDDAPEGYRIEPVRAVAGAASPAGISPYPRNGLSDEPVEAGRDESLSGRIWQSILCPLANAGFSANGDGACKSYLLPTTCCRCCSRSFSQRIFHRLC